MYIPLLITACIIHIMNVYIIYDHSATSSERGPRCGACVCVYMYPFIHSCQFLPMILWDRIRLFTRYSLFYRKPVIDSSNVDVVHLMLADSRTQGQCQGLSCKIEDSCQLFTCGHVITACVVPVHTE